MLGSSTRLVSQAVEALGPRLEAVCLFGSVSRDQGKENSDIDLLIVYHGIERPDKELREIVLRLREQREYQDLRIFEFAKSVFKKI